MALDVLATLVKYSTPPLCEALINQGFPACVSYVLSTDDITCMQNGGECLRAYVLNGYPQLVQWRNDAGQNGMHLVLQVGSARHRFMDDLDSNVIPELDFWQFLLGSTSSNLNASINRFAST